MSVPDLSAKTDAELDNLVRNHRARNAITAPRFLAALAELERRRGQGLNFDTTKRIILTAACARRFVAYKQIAEGSGADWARVHWSVGPHLDRMLDYCHGRGWPLLPVIVVPADAVATGRLRGESLQGFIRGCQRLGIGIHPSPEEFADTEQERVFSWAAAREPKEQ